MKKGDVNTSLKSTGARDELSITLYLQSEINFCSVSMPVNGLTLHHYITASRNIINIVLS